MSETPHADESTLRDSTFAAESDSRPLVVDLDGYEGPLDVLLALARSQKVDVTRLSILCLADQYLAFIAEARRLSLDVAGDYLVMAAWLAYLKSRLLLPDEAADEESSGGELAAHLGWRLKRLEAMREAATRLMRRDRLGRDVFRRGAPEGIRSVRRAEWDASLFELLSAYAGLKRGEPPPPLRFDRPETFSLEAALARLTSSLGVAGGWERLESFLPPGLVGGLSMRSAVASTLAAGLELSRDGKLSLRQERPFGPIYVRTWRPGDS